ncbi:MAG: hypothetical protein MRY63_08910 [Neomegalonema sp.]|nr:hypothetical protein [Neomegalonema sp.]
MLPRGRVPFHYYPDRYAVWLLQHVVGREARICDLKASRFRPLLDRPIIKQAIARKGNGRLTARDLAALSRHDFQTYHMTLGQWGTERSRRHEWSDFQTTRPGWNLVLQMNFSAAHNQPFRELIDDHSARPFEHSNHPVARGRNLTLAWARLDIDMTSREALIEEVQTDWLRLAAARLKYFKEHSGTCHDPEDADRRDRLDRARAYVERVLRPHEALWDRAILTATMAFLRESLQIRTIYMHEAECGAKVKNISGRKPPRSLYTKLPRSFCFEPWQGSPRFLEDNPSAVYQILKRRGDLRFWRHRFD